MAGILSSRTAAGARGGAPSIFAEAGTPADVAEIRSKYLSAVVAHYFDRLAIRAPEAEQGSSLCRVPCERAGRAPIALIGTPQVSNSAESLRRRLIAALADGGAALLKRLRTSLGSNSALTRVPLVE